MKPMKGNLVVKGKRKLNSAFVDTTPMKHPEPAAKRRTRSTSNADIAYTQRSTRRTQNISFFELPHNYSSRKQSQESEALSPTTPSPPTKKLRRSSARLAGNAPTKCGKENVTLLPNSSEEPVQANGVENDAKESDPEFLTNTKFTSPPPSKVANGQHEHNNSVDEGSIDILKKTCKQPHAGSDKLTLLHKASAELKVSTNGTSHVCSAVTSFKAMHVEEKDLKRKRRYSEETSSSCRIRRLSEKGEMASMMKFFFNNKKSTTISPLRSKSASQSHRKNAVCSGSLHPAANQATLPNSTFQKSVVKEAQDDMCISFTRPQSSPLTPLPACKEPKTSGSNSVEVSDENYHKEKNSSENDQSKTIGSRFSLNSTHCDVKVKNDSNKVPHEMPNGTNDDDQDEAGTYLKRRSLRSSGIRCQPNFYELGLDLMIHRNKKSKLHAADDTEFSNEEASKELQVLSDSEVYVKKERKGHVESPTSMTKPLITQVATRSPTQISSKSVCENENQVSPSAQTPCLSASLPELATKESKPKKLSLSPSSPQRKGKTKSQYRKKTEASTSLALSLKSTRSAATERDTVPSVDHESLPLFDKEPPSGPEVYYFESDHVALKHNKDYHSVLRAASVLEAQRKQALEELDILGTRLTEALVDPIAFVDRLQRKEGTALPTAKPVPPIPSIDWSKYISPFGTFENVFKRSSHPPPKPMTRRKNVTSADSGSSDNKSSSDHPPPSDDASNKAFRKIRSETFKKSWSVEEQRKLEELLIKFPQEPVEFNRFRKIAAELGGRTPLQVQSRVQKYFLKLAKAGMTVPGRMPRADRAQNYRSRSGNHRHRSHHQASLTRISTFFSDFHIPVKMGDDDDLDSTCPPGQDDEEDGGWGTMESEQVSDEEEIPGDLRFSDEYLEILRLKRLRKQRLCIVDKNGQRSIARHHGFQCDKCECEPIEGVRYHCIDCPQDESVDFCQSCIRSFSFSKFETAVHKSNHRTEPVYASVAGEKSSDNIFPPISRPYADVDYTRIPSATPCGEYNYLDPNFCPPSI